MSEKTVSEIIVEILDLVKNNNSYLRSIDHKLTLLLAKNNKNIVAEVNEIKTEAKPANEIIVVTQKITYPDGKGIPLVQVELFTGSKKYEAGDIPISKTKTNQMGRYQFKVKPGSYFVKLFKHATESKPQLDLFYPIIVKDQSPFELPDLKQEN